MVALTPYPVCCGARIITGFSTKPDAIYPVQSNYRATQLVARAKRESGKVYEQSGYVSRDYAYWSGGKWCWVEKSRYVALTAEELKTAKLLDEEEKKPKKTYGDRLKELLKEVGYDGKQLVECVLNESQIKLGWLPYLKAAGFECTRSWINGAHESRLYRFDIVPNKGANKAAEPKGWAELEEMTADLSSKPADDDKPVENPFAKAA